MSNDEITRRSTSQPATCATCKHIGVNYWYDGYRHTHHCLKGDVRRAEEMPNGADFFAHFRAFFDAEADQKACRHYEERPAADPEVINLLSRIGGAGEVRAWTDESKIAHSVSGKFLEEVQYAKPSQPCMRVYRLLPVGRAELYRATGEAQ